MCSVIAARNAAASPNGTDTNPGVNGPKPSRRVGVGGEADDRRRAAVEVVGAHDDLGAVGRDALDVVAPTPRGLDRGLDAFGAGVHRQHHVLAAQLGELGAERVELVVAERAARQREPIELRVRGREPAAGGGARSSAPSTRRGSRGSGGRRRRRPTRRRRRRASRAGARSSGRCAVLIARLRSLAARACSTSRCRPPCGAPRGRA